MRDLGGEELEEAVELVGVAPQRRNERRRIGVRGGLERAHLHLQAAAEALDPAEHAHGVALREAPVEQLDVVPDARVDPAARVDELQCEIRSAVPRPPPVLARHRVHAFDGPVLDQLGDRGHVASLDAWVGSARWPTSPRFVPCATRTRRAASSRRRTTSSPARERARACRARSAQRRPPDVERVARRRRAGSSRPGSPTVCSCVTREPAVWALAQDYVGPDGVARTRAGIVASLQRRAVRDARRPPHERTHAGPKERPAAVASRGPRAARADLSALRRRATRSSRPHRQPDLDVEGTRLWRIEGDEGHRRSSPAGSS